MGVAVKAVVVMPRLTGVPEDEVVNDFYFVDSGATDFEAADATTLTTALSNFYNDTHSPGTSDLNLYLSEALTRATNGCRIVYYAIDELDLGDPWGSPKFTRNWTLEGGVTGTPFPSEVAAALSFHADLTDIPETAPNPTPPPAIIRPAARRRGRIFIGPLQSIAGEEDGTTHENTPSAAFVNVLLGAAEYLGETTDTDTWTWCVYSGADTTMRPVVGGFVDDSWDTQRRRGSDTSTRFTFTIT